MKTFIKLFSNKNKEIKTFLNKYNKDFNLKELKNISNSCLEWQKDYDNPIEIADVIGVFIENNDRFKINMWVCLDKDLLINVTDSNADEIIRYLFERYPY